MPASFMQSLQGCLVRFSRSDTRSSNLQGPGKRVIANTISGGSGLSLVGTRAGAPHDCGQVQRGGDQGGTHLAREMDMLRCLAPLASAVMKGRLMSVLVADDSSHLAFSAASRRRCTASLSFDRSMPCTAATLRSGPMQRGVSSTEVSDVSSPAGHHCILALI